MRTLILIAILLLILACSSQPREWGVDDIPEYDPSPTPTWATHEAIGVIHTWLAEQHLSGETTCLDAYMFNNWTATYIERGTWYVEAEDMSGRDPDRSGAWLAFELTGTIARMNQNLQGC